MSRFIRPGGVGVALFFILALASFGQNAPAQDSAGVVSGTAIYRERIAMPKNAVFEATLEDVSRMDAPAETIGKAVMENPGNPPYHFSISYDPRRIVESHTYSVRATIKIDNQLAFTSDTSYPVITRGNGKEVNILLKSAGGRAAPVATEEAGRNASLENTTWNLTRLGNKEEKASEGERTPYIFLDPNGNRLSGSGGCNRLSGTYQLDKQTIRFGPTALTMMACPKGMDREKDFMEALGLARSWKIRGEELEFYDEDGKSLARFDAGETK
jgi:putative lipoprotein